VYQTLQRFDKPRGGVVLHGDGEGRNGSVGCDKLVHDAAEALGFRVHAFPADWDRQGKAAGPRRNKLVAEVLFAHGPAGFELAFLALSTGGPGTEGAHKIVTDMKKARDYPVHIEKLQVTL
jgi:hypothetical protein